MSIFHSSFRPEDFEFLFHQPTIGRALAHRLRSKFFLVDGTVFSRCRNKATFFDPHQYPKGIEQVLINGEFMVRDGALTEELPGRVITNRESFRNRQ